MTNTLERKNVALGGIGSFSAVSLNTVTNDDIQKELITRPESISDNLEKYIGKTHAGSISNLGVLNAIEEGANGIVAVHNNLKQHVNYVSAGIGSLLMQNKIKLAGWYTKPIEYIIAAQDDGTSLDNLTKVHSHPKAIEQISDWFNKMGDSIDQVPANSTTSYIGRLQKGEAVACSPSVLDLYPSLIPIEEGVGPGNNVTHFAALQHVDSPGEPFCRLTQHMAISILSVPNTRGSSEFPARSLNEAGVDKFSEHSIAVGGEVKTVLHTNNNPGIDWEYVNKNLEIIGGSLVKY